ncbi:hypothetical protein C1645_834904 [Glomus cerebriforme]|uniref:Crinkler effector protein N-terminal domain-containing protein n=1 Tax=Glomus cerebriforme TaxID=658196 RepID=A0A397SER9_9GLOM|nr:hypothetical protein C1645_834904 [Glomus cerebriforme]
MSTSEYYLKYNALITYLKERNDVSYCGFLVKHRSVIVASTSSSDECNSFDITWSSHFLGNAKKLLDSNAFANLKKKTAGSEEGTGNMAVNTFPVDIGRDQLVGHLKKVIREEIDIPKNVKAKDLKLWKPGGSVVMYLYMKPK